MSFDGIVQNGVVVLDAGHQLPDGTRVEVIVREASVLERVDLKPAADSFRQGWKEALSGETLPIDRLWEGIDGE